MLVSLRWLGRHIDIADIPPEKLAEDLTLSTAEVEGVHEFAPHLSEVVVGYVESREPHPGADKLSVCMVDIGGPEKLQIVCGAPNVAGGQKVAVGQVGTVLPGDLKLKKAKIRGVESRGMICSVRELDLGDEHDGIWVLPEDAAVGKPVAEALEVSDWVIEIDNKSLTHRPDLWGHRGIARELGAIYDRPLEPLDLTLPETGAGKPYPVRIESEACPRYLALPIDNVRQEQSPLWLRMLLSAIDERPHDLLVDLSNFVMFDLGQPNHLFDRTRLSPEGISVRMARPKEPMTTLDGDVHELTEADLLICSGDEPVALAGVMGGEGSKVAEGTSELLLEIANFHPTTIRRTAARLASRTQASARFEKNLDPNLPLEAAAHLVRTLASIQPDIRLPAPITDAGDWSDPAHTLTLRGDRVRRLLGAEIPNAEIASILTRLDFGVAEKDGRFEVRVPARRATKDVRIEEDLVEEVGRMHRYANLPESILTGPLVPPLYDARRPLVRKLQDRLAGGAGFHEVLGYSFVTVELLEKLGIADRAFVEIVNPVAEGSKVRRSVVPSLLALVEKNRRQRADVRLFEIGKGYLADVVSERGEPREVHELGLVWATEPQKDARFDQSTLLKLQAVIEDLLQALGLGPVNWRAAHPGEAPRWLHPGRALVCTVGGKTAGKGKKGSEVIIGFCGALEPGLAKPLGLSSELASEVAVADLSLDALLKAPELGSRYRPIPRFPEVKVDVALAVPEALPAGELIEAIEQAGKGLVCGAELFDVYQGPNIQAGTKSLAFHVLLQSDARTLTDKDQAKFLERLTRAAQRLGGELRSE